MNTQLAVGEVRTSVDVKRSEIKNRYLESLTLIERLHRR